MASKTSTRERRRGRGGKGERLSSEFSLGVFWQIYVFYDGGNFDVNNGEDGGRLSGAIDGDRWRFELEEEITSSLLPSFPPSLLPPFLLPSPFGRLILGVTAMLARSSSRRRRRFVVVRLEILGRPARSTQFAGFGAATLYDTIRAFAQSSFKMATHPFITAKI